MANEDISGLPNAFNRAAGKQEQQRVVFYGEGKYIQGAEMNDMQSIIAGRHNRVTKLIAKEGDRVEGANAIVNVNTGTVTLTAGKIIVDGDVFPVAQRVITGLPMDTMVQIGVRLVKQYITHEDDPSLLGLVPGSDAEGEPGAAREVATISWSIPGLNEPGAFYRVYDLVNGTIIDQTPPALLEGMAQALAIYDRPLGHYIVDGFRVTALGKDAGKQRFSIEQGECNVNGFKFVRLAASRHEEVEEWDTIEIPGETHTYTGGASHTFNLDVFPLDTISQILLTKEKTVTVTRGAVSGGADALPDTSVVSLIEVKQGGTTYVAATDYNRVGNTVSWAPGGAEPAGGSSYTVTYRYRDDVTATSTTTRTVTVSGGATGGDIIISYTAKMQRIDALCVNMRGQLVYVKGVSAQEDPLPPSIPSKLLALCQIRNTFEFKPSVTNDGTRSIPYARAWKYFNFLLDLGRLMQIERMKSHLDAKDPVLKKGEFVDPFMDDDRRDAGEVQTAAVGNGALQLAIKTTITNSTLKVPVMLDWTEEIITNQALKTACVKINEYANFTPLPGALELDPPVDFWSVSETVWESPETIEFQLGTLTQVQTSAQMLAGTSTQTVTQTQQVDVDDEVIDQRQEQAKFLRPISVAFKISGFGVGEILETLTFDNIDVKPAGTQTADANGEIAGTFTIPTGIPVGVRVVYAEGFGGTKGWARFTGRGVINVTTMQEVTTITTQGTITVTNGVGGGGWGDWGFGGGGGGNDVDPQAQLFAVAEDRQIVGVDFHLCAIGNQNKKIIVNQVTVDNGYPTSRIVSEAFVPMVGAVTGWKSARYRMPVFADDSAYHAFVIKSDDNTHSVSLAKLGGFDTDLQQFVTKHPNIIGPRFSSVNASTWTAHQDEALAFRLVAAKYTSTIKTVALGNWPVTNASDLQIRATVHLPSDQCVVGFEIERPNGTIYRVRPYQVVKLREFITETLIVRAVLRGTAKLSPVLFAPIQFVAGRILTSGTYVTRAFELGSLIDVLAYIKAYLPGGATMTMQYDFADDNWQNMTLDSTEALTVPGWVERKYTAGSLTSALIRLKITLNGGPAARAELTAFGANLI